MVNPIATVMIMAGCYERIGLNSPPLVTTPTVSSTNPANNAVAVPFNQKITATFSEAMDSATITTATFTLMQGSTFVSGTVSYTGTTTTFAPSSNLAPNTLYIATITTMAKNVEGSALATNYVWSFTTGASAAITPPTVSLTDPLNGATGVPINQKIAASFSVAMDASTITASTFTLLRGTTPVSGFVSYSGTTAIFKPDINLLPSTAYTATITTGSKDLAGIAMVNNYVWSFISGAGVVVTPPTVSLTDPLNLATGVALNQKIAATFSKTMDASTLTSATFTLKQGTTSVSGFVSYSGSTAIFAPASNLLPTTIYTATITTGSKDLTGNALATDYVWTFTTGAGVIVVPPTVISTDPLNNALGVALDKKIGATFSKTMDAATLTTATFTLMQGSTSISGFVSYSGTTATFTPTGNLLSNKIYIATITTGAKDLTGNALAANYEWTFTTVVVNPPTVISTDPLDAAINVALDKKIAATFSKSMDASTITASTFNLKQGTNSISGFVSYTGTIATFTPASNLIQNTTYTATITTGAKDLAGNSLASEYVWSFKTVATYSVTLSAIPAAGGIITQSGTGTYDSGSSVTVTATPNAGFKFTNWTESGIEVSTTASYQFTITGDRILVGNFAVSVVGQLPVNLGSAARFAILSNSAITNIPTSAITGDVGISPGARSSITGFVLTLDGSNTFSTSPEVTGQVFAADDAVPTPAMLILAKNDAEVAYLDATAAVRGIPTSISGNINGLTLVPGLYESGSSIEISPGGKLYLDAQGDASAVFIIRSATSITTEATSEVVLTGSANAANIFWSAGSAVTLGTNSKMKGTIIASTSISLLTGARLDGRALIQSAAAGQVSLDQNIIVKP